MDGVQKERCISHLISEVDEHSKNVQTLTGQLVSMTSDRDEWVTKHRVFEKNTIENMSKLTTDRDNWMSKYSTFEKEANGKIEVLDKEISDWKTQKIAWDNSRTDFEGQLKTWNFRSGEWETEKTSFSTNLSDKETELQNWTVRFSDWENEKSTIQKMIAERNQELQNWNIRLGDWENEKSDFQKNIEARDADINNWTLNFGHWESEKADFQKTIEARDADIQNWNLNFTKLEAQKWDSDKVVAEKDAEIQNWKIRFGEWESEKTNFASNLEIKDAQIHQWSVRFGDWQNERELWRARMGEWESEKTNFSTAIETKDAELENWSARAKTWETERNNYLNNISSWRDRFGILKDEYDDLLLKSSEYESKLAAVPKNFNCGGKAIRWDDLKIVEGIGPKIEEILHNAGIKTWAALAAAPVEKLQEILDAAGPRYKLSNPTSWPEQAKLADSENCDELTILQERLTGGRDIQIERTNYKAQAKEMERTQKSTGLDEASVRKAHETEVGELSLKFLGKKVKADDHQIVEGIGPKIDELLRNAGISTWLELSKTAPEKIKAILDAAGPRFQMHNPATWPEQARLAHENKFEKLKSYQDQLNAGKA